MTQFPFGGVPAASPFQQAPQFAAAPVPPAPMPAYPQAPGYPAPPQQFAAPAPSYPAPPAYPAPAPYGQQFGQPFYPQQAPAPQPQFAPGNLGAFYGQPRTGRPQAVSWKGAPDGSTIVGVIAEDVTDKDVVLDTDPNTHAVKTFRDGSPRYALVVTLKVQPSQTFPEGLASLYLRGDLWDKTDAAMKAAGRNGAPKAGDLIQVTLAERRPGRGQVPRNIFTVQYAAAGTDGPAPAAPPAQAPAQWEQPPAQPDQAAPAQVTPPAMPVQAPAAPQLPQAAFPGVAFQAPVQAAQLPTMPVPPAAPAQGALPGMPDPAALTAQMTPEQLALLAQLKGQG